MKLWKENKTANLYELSPQELAELFNCSVFATEKYDNWGVNRRLSMFICSGALEGGLNSIWDVSSKEGQRDFKQAAHEASMLLNKRWDQKEKTNVG